MAGTVKKKCTCTSAFQDERYGKKVRIYNLSLSGKSATCTVCGAKK